MPNRILGYRLSPLAERDLEDIWVYTLRTWSRDQADRYHASIIAALDGLISGEKIGRDASDIRDGYRRYAVGRHVLFYGIGTDYIVVIRILHQSMDIPGHFGGEA